MRTDKIGGNPAVGEPAGGSVVDEVFAVGREVAFGEGEDGVVVPRVHDRVPEHRHRRHQCTRSTVFLSSPSSNKRSVVGEQTQNYERRCTMTTTTMTMMMITQVLPPH